MAVISTASFQMKGGDGPYSYAHNSSYQREGLECAKDLIKESVAEKLDMKEFISSSSSPKLFTIADLGCAFGPNTLFVVENIIDSVELKYHSFGKNQEALEFLVLFSDRASNDFNTLFRSLPSDKKYFAAGVPGLFQDRLVPKASLHFAHCSYSLHWLSKIPMELVDRDSPAWNKGRIFYHHSPDEVSEAYSAQFAKDMEYFLNARAEELVCGGLMALVVPCIPDGISKLEFSDFKFMDLMEESLKDMVDVGLLTEDKVDSFNLPQYHPSPVELGALIERNTRFSIEKMQRIVRPARKVYGLPSLMSMIRAIWEELIQDHFGTDIVDELFDRLKKKIADSNLSSLDMVVDMFVLLRRKID